MSSDSQRNGGPDMARQVALTIPKPVLEQLRPGERLPRQWELVWLALTAAEAGGRTELTAALRGWLARMDELTALKNELIRHERNKLIEERA